MFIRYQHSNYSGDLTARLEALNLRKHFNDYRLLVKYDWLRPAFHVPIPEECFRIDESIPLQWPPVPSPIPHWADAYDHQMSISESQIGTDEWFVHPLVRRGSSRLDFFDHAISNHEDYSWRKMHHSEGRNFVPAFDYFYEWQLLRFADVVQRMQGAHQHFWQLGQHADLVRHANEVSVSDFDKVADIPIWATRAEAFTWLAHFINYRNAFESYAHEFVAKHKHADVASQPALNAKLLNERKLGATQLMDWLGITSAMLEQALQHQILTLAQDWRGRPCKYDKTAEKLPLWYALQSQVHAAVGWLCLANDDSPTVYLDRLRYDYLGQREWAQLQDVSRNPRWNAARLVASEIVDVAKKYSTGRCNFAGDFSPNPAQLFKLAEEAIAFGSYLDALGNFLDESQHASEDDPYRPRNRTSWYRITAVMAEIALQELMSKKGIAKKGATCRSIARLLSNAEQDWPKLESGQRTGDTSAETLATIADRVRQSHSSDELILNFSLAVHYARNTTAHQTALDSHFLYADWAGPIFDALVLFVPWALMELQSTNQSAWGKQRQQNDT